LNFYSKSSITGRLTLLFSLASSGVLLALGMVIASSVEKHFEEQDMEVLSGKMERARHALAKVSSPVDLQNLTELHDHSFIGHHTMEVMILDPSNNVLFATSADGLPIDSILASIHQKPNQPVVWNHGGQAYRGLVTKLATGDTTQPQVTVAVAMDMVHHESFMQSFQQTLWVFVACAAALTGLLGWTAARHGLAPLHAMREQTKAITAHQLDQRLSIGSVPSELGELVQTLNEMLTRLQGAFQRLSGFSSDIAHELRTPVSNLMTQTQVALSRPRTADGYRNILESNAEEFERMARMISDMLLLAKAENELAVLNREKVNLPSEILALFDYYEAVAAEKDLRLIVEGSGEIVADRLMLRRALGNLLSNAIRYSAANSTITVTIRESQSSTAIDIENIGDPIPAEFLERIFDRFFRVDPSRQRRTEGNGLGLAITKSIVIAHQGTISAASSGERTTFSITLP
jgi:two-component system heavy metal sensor histidine kinase CusS